ncbi:hypothetical protein XU18_2553 [Perkinsela sp. CCAP 1560/4]|nr:hypothetical protein XU18_4135 [Perkinsela sp. CCAP 1560/4]KNH06652.1 hypothetical protein XU18_2553 [Perkinsela sp. CCAP 1560/4]|eukprot:KNH04647.1 hypothetical protein XU18_4135 [Perkinsela sp. CCAP 1560/4]
MLDNINSLELAEKAVEPIEYGDFPKGNIETVADVVEDSLLNVADCSTISHARSEKRNVTRRNTRKRSRRVVHCAFCDDKEYLPYCPRTGIPHRMGSLYYCENREIDPVLSAFFQLKNQKIQTANTVEQSPVRASQKLDGKSEGNPSILSSGVKNKREHALSKCLGTSSSSHVAASAVISKPLAAFGFTLKTKSVTDPNVRLQNALIHEFQDNDETRRMSTYWYTLREEGSNPLNGLQELLANLGNFDHENSPSASFSHHKAHNYQAFLSEVFTHSNPINEENFDDELVLASWSAEGYEEIQSRPPYFGTHNLYRELRPKLFNTRSISLIAQEEIMENGYDNSAEEWQSEPSDAESCSSEGESDDDLDELNEFDDVVVPDEEENAQNSPENIEAKDQDIEQIAQERESSRNRHFQRNLLKASRGEIVRARVTEFDGDGAPKGTVFRLWDLKLLTFLGSPEEQHFGEDSSATTSPGLVGLNPESSDAAIGIRKHVYESVDSFFIKLMQTEMIDRRHVDSTLFQTRISAKEKAQAKNNEKAMMANGDDGSQVKPMLEGNDLQVFIDFIMKHQNSGFSAQILCHEFRKENPVLGASYDLRHALRKNMFRKADIWKIRRKQEPKLPKADDSPVQDPIEKVELENHNLANGQCQNDPCSSHTLC